jgi:hypothetical protein
LLSVALSSSSSLLGFLRRDAIEAVRIVLVGNKDDDDDRKADDGRKPETFSTPRMPIKIIKILRMISE